MATASARIARRKENTASSAYSNQQPSLFDELRTDSTRRGYLLLRIGFVVAPILFGLDKFADILVDWEECLAPWIVGVIPLAASDAVHLVGVVEILAGIALAFKPRYGPYLVAAWLGGFILNLLTGAPIRALMTTPSATSG